MRKLEKNINRWLLSHGYALNQDQTLYIEQLAHSLKDENQFQDYNAVLKWLENKKKEYKFDLKEVPVNQLEKWHVDENTKNIHHETGKFFSIIGLQISGVKNREVDSWSQPIMKQAECGILGILTKKFNGIRHYLLQAKFEPGNKYAIQLSPTLQATDSNLKRMHGGKTPLFYEYFLTENCKKNVKILRSVESVEDGSRFYLKTNRNVLIEVYEEVVAPEDFIWLTFYQIRKLLKIDNVVNSLVRSIFGSL